MSFQSYSYCCSQSSLDHAYDVYCIAASYDTLLTHYQLQWLQLAVHVEQRAVAILSATLKYPSGNTLWLITRLRAALMYS